MPKKSVREMKKWEKYRYSLQGRVFQDTILGAVLLGVVMLIIGLGLYVFSLANQYISESFSLASSTAATISVNNIDIKSMTETVMGRYRSMTPEERAKTGTKEYRDRFMDVMGSDDFVTLFITLMELCDASDVNDLYVGVYDKETQSLVYICDPDLSDETGFFPGEWEIVSEREIDKFVNWDGRKKLYDISNTEKYGYMCTSGMPIWEKEEQLEVFALADVTLSNLMRGVRNYVLQYTVALVLVIIVLSRILTKRMKKTVVDPINKIAVAAQKYLEDRQYGKGESDHFSALNIKTGDEVENLSLVMADMEEGLAEYEENLTKVTAERERIRTELTLATRIQADMLPNKFPAFPDRPEFDVYASMTPAKEVGGDFYDFYLVDEDHLAVVMADVSGKGIPAALFMMASKIILKNIVMQGCSPAEALEKTNRAICNGNHEEMFVTIWLGILEISTGILTAANAGHEYPVLTDEDGRFIQIKDKHGLVIGAMEGMKYENYELRMKPGSKLFVYTDGVPEATNANKELFGTERMLEALNDEQNDTPVHVLEAVQLAVDHFVEDAEQFDDLTMLCLDYKGSVIL